jgi:hypothetical protein
VPCRRIRGLATVKTAAAVALCVLLDGRQEPHHVRYVEEGLGLLVAWLSADGIACEPRTRQTLGKVFA